MRITIRDSFVDGDVVATEDSTIVLENSVVTGQLVEADNGRILVNGREAPEPGLGDTPLEASR